MTIVAESAGRALLAVATAALTAGCATTPSVALRTWDPPEQVACPAARTEGVLARNPLSGAGLRDAEGVAHQVIWPTDYTARADGGRLVVLDGAGTVIAHEGDFVEMGGQDVEDGAWFACGGMRAVRP